MFSMGGTTSSGPNSLLSMSQTTKSTLRHTGTGNHSRHNMIGDFYFTDNRVNGHDNNNLDGDDDPGRVVEAYNERRGRKNKKKSSYYHYNHPNVSTGGGGNHDKEFQTKQHKDKNHTSLAKNPVIGADSYHYHQQQSRSDHYYDALDHADADNNRGVLSSTMMPPPPPTPPPSSRRKPVFTITSIEEDEEHFDEDSCFPEEDGTASSQSTQVTSTTDRYYGARRKHKDTTTEGRSARYYDDNNTNDGDTITAHYDDEDDDTRDDNDTSVYENSIIDCDRSTRSVITIPIKSKTNDEGSNTDRTGTDSSGSPRRLHYYHRFLQQKKQQQQQQQQQQPPTENRETNTSNTSKITTQNATSRSMDKYTNMDELQERHQSVLLLEKQNEVTAPPLVQMIKDQTQQRKVRWQQQSDIFYGHDEKPDDKNTKQELLPKRSSTPQQENDRSRLPDPPPQGSTGVRSVLETAPTRRGRITVKIHDTPGGGGVVQQQQQKRDTIEENEGNDQEQHQDPSQFLQHPCSRRGRIARNSYTVKNIINQKIEEMAENEQEDVMKDDTTNNMLQETTAELATFVSETQTSEGRSAGGGDAGTHNVNVKLQFTTSNNSLDNFDCNNTTSTETDSDDATFEEDTTTGDTTALTGNDDDRSTNDKGDDDTYDDDAEEAGDSYGDDNYDDDDNDCTMMENQSIEASILSSEPGEAFNSKWKTLLHLSHTSPLGPVDEEGQLSSDVVVVHRIPSPPPPSQKEETESTVNEVSSLPSLLPLLSSPLSVSKKNAALQQEITREEEKQIAAMKVAMLVEPDGPKHNDTRYYKSPSRDTPEPDGLKLNTSASPLFKDETRSKSNAEEHKMENMKKSNNVCIDNDDNNDGYGHGDDDSSCSLSTAPLPSKSRVKSTKSGATMTQSNDSNTDRINGEDFVGVGDEYHTKKESCDNSNDDSIDYESLVSLVETLPSKKEEAVSPENINHVEELLKLDDDSLHSAATPLSSRNIRSHQPSQQRKTTTLPLTKQINPILNDHSKNSNTLIGMIRQEKYSYALQRVNFFPMDATFTMYNPASNLDTNGSITSNLPIHEAVSTILNTSSTNKTSHRVSAVKGTAASIAISKNDDKISLSREGIVRTTKQVNVLSSIDNQYDQQIQLELLAALIRSYPAALSTPGLRGFLPIHLACGGLAPAMMFSQHHVQIVHKLLIANPDAARDSSNNLGQLPLHIILEWAVNVHDLDVVSVRYDDIDDIIYLYDDHDLEQDKDEDREHNEDSIEQIVLLLLMVYPEGSLVTDKLGRKPIDIVQKAIRSAAATRGVNECKQQRRRRRDKSTFLLRLENRLSIHASMLQKIKPCSSSSATIAPHIVTGTSNQDRYRQHEEKILKLEEQVKAKDKSLSVLNKLLQQFQGLPLTSSHKYQQKEQRQLTDSINCRVGSIAMPLEQPEDMFPSRRRNHTQSTSLPARVRQNSDDNYNYKYKYHYNIDDDNTKNQKKGNDDASDLLDMLLAA